MLFLLKLPYIARSERTTKSKSRSNLFYSPLFLTKKQCDHENHNHIRRSTYEGHQYIYWLKSSSFETQVARNIILFFIIMLHLTVRMRFLNIFFYNFAMCFSDPISVFVSIPVAALKCLPSHSFNVRIILIIRDCVYNHFPLFISLDHLLGKILALLCVVFSRVCNTFPYGVPGHVRYLIGSIPDLFLPLYFDYQSCCLSAVWWS